MPRFGRSQGPEPLALCKEQASLIDFLEPKNRVEMEHEQASLMCSAQSLHLWTHAIFQNFHFHSICLETKAQEHENTFRHSEAEQTDFGKVRDSLKSNIWHILYSKKNQSKQTRPMKPWLQKLVEISVILSENRFLYNFENCSKVTYTVFKTKVNRFKFYLGKTTRKDLLSFILVREILARGVSQRKRLFQFNRNSRTKPKDKQMEEVSHPLSKNSNFQFLRNGKQGLVLRRVRYSSKTTHHKEVFPNWQTFPSSMSCLNLSSWGLSVSVPSQLSTLSNWK